MKDSKFKEWNLDHIKMAGEEDLNNSDKNYARFKLSLEHAKLAKKVANGDLGEYLNIWRAFAYRYYPVGRRILHVPLEFNDNPSKFHEIIRENLFTIYAKLIKIDGTINSNWFNNIYFGFISLIMGNIPHATQMFLESLSFDNAEIRSFLGCIYFEKSRFVDAQLTLEASIDIDPGFYGNYLLLITCYKELELHELVLGLADKGLEQFPDDWCLLMEKASAFKILGEDGLSQATLQVAIQELSRVKAKYPEID